LPRPRTNLDLRLARSITQRTGGRIRSLRVESQGENVVVHGYAASYYARQLAFAAVSEVLDALDQDRRQDVKLDIEVTGS
jgi:hypothetical protein